MDEGGYENPLYWEELISHNNESRPWQEILKSFVDRSGLPGPSTWTDQRYPIGEDNYPVTGINWFEANAYARFVGKSIPTKDHWGLGRGEGTLLIRIPQVGGNAHFAPFSNFHGDGPVETGLFNGITSFGAYDMPGNVREWCWNESDQGRWVRGGAWNDNPYMFKVPSQTDPLDRSKYNGFRCAFYPTKDSIPGLAFDLMETIINRKDTPIPEPIDDEEFARYEDFYEYE